MPCDQSFGHQCSTSSGSFNQVRIECVYKTNSFEPYLRAVFGENDAILNNISIKYSMGVVKLFAIGVVPVKEEIDEFVF